MIPGRPARKLSSCFTELLGTSTSTTSRWWSWTRSSQTLRSHIGCALSPADIWDEAFGWLKLQAMQRGIIPRDQALIERMRAADVARAAGLESQGDLAQALREYRSLVADFKGLADV